MRYMTLLGQLGLFVGGPASWCGEDDGLARPAECPDTHGRHTADAWGPRGAFGLAGYRAAAVGRCASPQILDVPIVSAAIALAHLVELERRGFCDPARRRAAWRMGIRRARDHRCLTDARARFR